jgi:hypothetical protein
MKIAGALAHNRIQQTIDLNGRHTGIVKYEVRSEWKRFSVFGFQWASN